MRGLAIETLELIEFARSLLARLHPMTLRQLHYTIFSAAVIRYDNTPEDYKRLSRATTKARRLHRDRELAGYPQYVLDDSPDAFPGSWIVDETRKPEIVNMFDNAHEYLDAVKRSYRRNAWQDQPTHVELWSEKGTVLGALRPVTESLGVTLRVCHGFGSTGMETQIGEFFADIQKEITVFYLGDHDPSGHDIERDMHKQVRRAAGKDFNMFRLAIHAADIEDFRLPPQRIKPKDSRAKGFEHRFGLSAATVELDALPVEELRRRVRSAIEVCIEPEAWNRQLVVETAELASIADFADRVKNLPQLDRENQP